MRRREICACRLTPPTLTVQPATCGGAGTLLGQTACEDSAGICDAGGHTTRDACEASNGGAGVYTPAVYANPPGALSLAAGSAAADVEVFDHMGRRTWAGQARFIPRLRRPALSCTGRYSPGLSPGFGRRWRLSRATAPPAPSRTAGW